MDHNCEWREKYRALAMGVESDDLVERAEMIVAVALKFAATTAEPFPIVMDALLDTMRMLRGGKPPVDTGRLMPSISYREGSGKGRG